MLRRGFAAALAFAVIPAPAIAYPQAVSPRVEKAIKSSAKSDRDLKVFYKALDYQSIWIQGSSLGPEAGQLVELITSAELDGLNPQAYKPRALVAAVEKTANGSPKSLAKAEILLSRALVGYVRDLRRARDVGVVYLDRELSPTPPTPQEVLQAAAAAPSLQSHIAAMQWMNPVYADLREGLAANRERQSGYPPVWVPAGPSLKSGVSGDRVRMLRQRLSLPEGETFDASVAKALREFQAARGLPEDAVAGPRTIAALNESPRDREQTIRANLERARALPANPGRRYILVDAASARLWLYENGQVRDTMRAIVGKPEEQTPMLAGLMRYAIVNPYWNVPPDLAQRRVAPNVLSKGVSYLKTMRYEVLSDWSADARVLDPKKVDWAAVAAGRQELRVRQLPGKGNMMGKMKFMMPNDLGIYLHDTPEKALFREDDRQFSSGCVRVEDAPRLAKWLFGKPLVARSSAPEQRVNLPEPVPVYITYLTAAPAPGGLVFHDDVYGRDALARSGNRSAAVASRR